MVKNKIYIIPGIIVIVVLGIFLYVNFSHFSGYSVKDSLNLENTQRTGYEKIFDRLLSYNPDGASLLGFDGDVKWNVSYEMQNPALTYSAGFALIFDERGSLLELLDRQGEVCKISTSYPISIATVSDKGHIAVVMQQPELAYIEVYKSDGSQLASGQIHCASSGYPLALALSSEGESLAVSTLHLSESDIKNDILIYTLTQNDELRDNNKVLSYSYSSEIIPCLSYVKGDALIGFGGKGVRIFTSKSYTEVFFEKEVKSALYNDKMFGVIIEEEDEAGKLQNILKVFNVEGRERFRKEIPDAYSVCEINEDNEIVVINSTQMEIFTSIGVKKLECALDDEVAKVFPGNGFKEYYIVQNGQLLKINLE